VPAAKIRRPSVGGGDAAANTEYRVGDAVEYFGQSQARWIPAKVLKVTPHGTRRKSCGALREQELLVREPRSALRRMQKATLWSTSARHKASGFLQRC